MELNLEILNDFDFTDFADDVKITDELNKDYIKMKGFKKYFIYKLTNNGEPDKEKLQYAYAFWLDNKIQQRKNFPTDPDSHKPCNQLLQNIHHILWNRNIWEKCINSKTGYICSDTMNSVQTSLNKYVKLNYNESDKEKYKNIKNGCSLKSCIDKFVIDKEPDKWLDSETLLNFINLYHTLGNFIPVPSDFNKERANVNGAADYWQNTLNDIYCYYDDKACGKSNTTWLDKYSDWLDSFGSWDDFIEKNYLQDYVVEINDKNKYSVQLSMFFPHEDFINKDLYKSNTDIFIKYSEHRLFRKMQTDKINDKLLENFFENAAYCIEKRTERMIDVLIKKATENKEVKKTLLDLIGKIENINEIKKQEENKDE